MLLGIDYGNKNIGLALGEERGPAVPWKIIPFEGVAKLVEDIQDLILELKLTAIVVGWPLSMSGAVNERTEKTDVFVKALQQATDVEVILEDERLTSSIVTSATGKSKSIDDKSAAHILQTYIDRSHVNDA